ncbi:MAG: energy-coupling factor ABC transporter permease [Rhodospirillales bacterium]|nr:energy-coupling factor ABC transporter permease [Rhodospirillales bacterium]MCW8951891.1 energy-coupling factor ABC transporter permease [Rhodospirillales bacterium]MCW9001141.1 energy-coupling factor ABC transporter permease [Rhodospirillales bacterium]
MHIEPGFVAPAKVILANAGAVTVVAWGVVAHLKQLVREPWAPLKTVAAAAFFSVFMESFHMPVGASELHFVGAMAMYLTLGFVPVLLGFGLGLLVQGLLFNPGDLIHLGVNSLSLMLPLLTVHYTMGRRLFDKSLNQRISWARIVQLDAMYYAGVTGMVGFWLFIGEVQTPFSAWLSFAASYLALVAVEPFVTLLAVKGLKKYEETPLVSRLFAVKNLQLAK